MFKVIDVQESCFFKGGYALPQAFAPRSCYFINRVRFHFVEPAIHFAGSFGRFSI